MRKHLTCRSALLLTASAIVIASPALAQTTSGEPARTPIADPKLEQSVGEIVVTAQRRTEAAQRVPISLTALPAETLRKATIDNIQSLPRLAPSLFVQRSPQSANTRISIRGIGSAGNAALEPSVGAFVDGFYIARPGPLLAGLNDIASVEVLRGPQGTLFGRNASVGALTFRTNLPTQDFGGSAGLEIGSFGKVRATATLNVPVSDDVQTRLAVLYDKTDGFGRNVTDGARLGTGETLSLRGTVKARLTSNLDWIVRADYQHQGGDGLSAVSLLSSTLTPASQSIFVTRLNGLTPRLDTDYSRFVRQISGGNLDDDQWGISSEASWDLGGPTLRLLSGYRDWNSLQGDRDFSLTPADLIGRQTRFISRTHSEELQLLSPSGGSLNYVAGLYYFRERYIIDGRYNLGSNYCGILIHSVLARLEAACNAGPKENASLTYFSQATESLAAYGQTTLSVTKTWDITGGLRYTHDSKDAVLTASNPNAAGALIVAPDNALLKTDGGRLTYRVNTTFRPTRDVMLFATLSTGFKSGGFDSGFGSALGQNRVFRPETVTNAELGVKSEWLDRRVTVNATAFRMDVDDFQLRSYNGTTFTVRNAGSIRQQGVEFDLSARPTRKLTFGLTGTRLASQYTSFQGAPGLPGFGGVQDLTSKRVPFSPKWQGTGSVDYRTALTSSLDIGFNGRVSFMSDMDVGGAADNNPQGIQPGFALLGSRLTVYGPQDRWQFAISGENLANKGYCVGIYSQTFGGALGLNDRVTGGTVQRCILGEPRTVRASISAKF